MDFFLLIILPVMRPYWKMFHPNCINHKLKIIYSLYLSKIIDTFFLIHRWINHSPIIPFYDVISFRLIRHCTLQELFIDLKMWNHLWVIKDYSGFIQLQFTCSKVNFIDNWHINARLINLSVQSIWIINLVIYVELSYFYYFGTYF